MNALRANVRTRMLLISLVLMATPEARASSETAAYFPPPDRDGGWRQLDDPAQIARRTGMQAVRLDEAFEYVQGTTKHGALLVVRHGWLVYERYFGLGHREATPNGASVGKSFTSVAVGILMNERPDLFPDGLDQRIFTGHHMPPDVFPLTDSRKADIKLGQLLSMTAGIRGNNPGLVRGQPVMLDPAGPDGWQACVDEMAAGRLDGPLNTRTLWCDPGEGYSYATSSIHLASMMLRHITGQELEAYIGEHLAKPLGWGRWGWGYRSARLDHTPGGGGIALRATDMLRFAYLLLREGRWENNQIVPADYVRRCRNPSGYNPHSNYSLQFVVNDAGAWPGVPRDAFWKTGSGGHCIYIIPSLDLVVYKMGGRDGQYDPGNTGVPPPPENVFKYDGSREGWRGPAPADAYEQTIRRVIAALDPPIADPGHSSAQSKHP